MSWVAKELGELKRAGRYRELLNFTGVKGTTLLVHKGKRVVNFCSNDYLGLRSHPKMKESAIKAIEKWGTGASASRLVSGNIALFDELEELIASFKGYDASLVFPSGYQTNCGVIPALVGKEDVIISDELNHASLIDGIRLSRAESRIFPHLDLKKLKNCLEGTKKFRRRMIVIESLYSMDGDIPNLPEVLELAKRYDAMLYLDEAHATGVLGKSGRGAMELFGIKKGPEILMGTMSKALGASGGFICCSKEMRSYIINRARSFIYSTGLNPPAIACAKTAIEILLTDAEPKERLERNLYYAKNEFQKLGFVIDSKIPIIPIVIGDEKKTMKISRKLLEEGFFVQGIRPPSVPQQTSRLRITITAGHTKSQIENLVFALKKLGVQKKYVQ